jgi:Papain-like cysteine protease AvrRpt2
MALARNESIEYHQQNIDTYCGPAAAMMILRALDGKIIQEQDLFPSLNANMISAWATDPDDFALTLNKTSKSPFTNTFGAGPYTSEIDATQAIVETLLSRDGPVPAALIFGNGHWVVVTDVNVAEPLEMYYGGPLTIKGLFIHNPSVVSPPDEKHVHDDSDACGTDEQSGNIYANQYISYDAWKRDYLTGYLNYRTKQFSVVCGGGRITTGGIQSQDMSGLFRAVIDSMRGTNGLIDEDAARYIATQSIALHGLDRLGPLQDITRDARFETPVIVDQIDDAGYGEYYLVPLVRGNAITGQVQIDGLTGTFMGLSRGARKETYSHQTRRALFDDLLLADNVSPRLVWAPSTQSRSPFDPIYVATAEDTSLVFQDGRGKRYDGLTRLTAQGLAGDASPLSP